MQHQRMHACVSTTTGPRVISSRTPAKGTHVMCTCPAINSRETPHFKVADVLVDLAAQAQAAAGTARHGAPAHHSYPRSQHTCVARSHTIATLRTTHAHRDPANATSLLSTSLLSLPLIEPPTTWVLPPTPGQHDKMRLVLYARGSWCRENCKAPRGTRRIYRRGPRLSRRLSRRL